MSEKYEKGYASSRPRYYFDFDRFLFFPISYKDDCVSNNQKEENPLIRQNNVDFNQDQALKDAETLAKVTTKFKKHKKSSKKEKDISNLF